MKCCFKKYAAPLEKCREWVGTVDRDALAAQALQLRDQAGELILRADDAVHYSVERAREFGFFEFAMFKLCLLSLGLWLGSLFASFFKRFRVVLFIGFVASYIYLIWRLFFRDDD